MNKIIIIVLFFFNLAQWPMMAQEFESRPAWKETFAFQRRLSSEDWNAGTNLENRILNTSFNNQIVEIKNGKLILKAIESTSPNGEKRVKESYINTYHKQSFKYGKLEIRARFPIGKGVWPAIWLVSENRDTFPRGEIDIFEYIDCLPNNQFQGNIHYVISPNKRKMKNAYCKTDITNFHVYTLEWTPYEIRLKCDEKLYLSYKKDNANGWVFNENYYLILNLAFGSGWGASCGVDMNVLPCQMEVDWIKYYKYKD